MVLHFGHDVVWFSALRSLKGNSCMKANGKSDSLGKGKMGGSFIATEMTEGQRAASKLVSPSLPS